MSKFDIYEWQKKKYVTKVLKFDKVKDQKILNDIKKSGLSATQYVRELAKEKN